MGDKNLRLLSLDELRKLGKNKTKHHSIEKVERTGNVFPQSSAQQGQWFTEQMSMDCIYNVPESYLLEGEVDEKRFEEALNIVIQKQESMRTVFKIIDNIPSQIIEDYVPYKLEHIDISDLSHEQQKEKIEKINRNVACTAFDLKLYPLWRFVLIHLGDKKYVFTFTMHHIISDGWSFQVFIRTLLDFYKNGNADQELKIQYVDYTMWQKRQLETESMMKKREFWKNYLNGAPAEISLAYDYPNDENISHKGNNLFLTIPYELLDSMREYAQKEHVTLYHLFLAAYYIILHYASGDKDICIGTPFANRLEKEFEELIGLFMNTFVIRKSINPDEKLRDFIISVSKELLKTEENADVPFEDVVADMNLDRRHINSPIFQCLFVQMDMTNMHSGMEIDNLKITPLETDTGTAQFDFSIYVTVRENDCSIRIEYKSDIFADETIKHLSDIYIKTLEAIVKKPDKTISDYLSEIMPMKFDIMISSTFVSDMLAESLNYWKKKLALPFDVVFTPYSQVFQELYFEDSQMNKNEYGFNVFVIRPEDWGQGKGKEGIDNIETNVRDFVDAINSSKTSVQAVYVCPSSDSAASSPEFSEFIKKQENLIMNEITVCETVYVDSLAEKYELNDYKDDESDKNWHIPYNREMFSLIGTNIIFDLFDKIKK